MVQVENKQNGLCGSDRVTLSLPHVASATVCSSCRQLAGSVGETPATKAQGHELLTHLVASITAFDNATITFQLTLTYDLAL